MKVLITGGYGFIGSNFIRHFLSNNNKSKIINLDALFLGSNKLNLKGIHNDKYQFIKGNICNKKTLEKLIGKVDLVVNFAAESHVDRSINESFSFLKSNVIGVHNILEILRKKKNVKFLHISTDEVYGDILKGKFKENSAFSPSNPYSATKAAAEMLIKSYQRTYDLDVIITRSVNNYGPYQFPEKLIPKSIIMALNDQKIPIHGLGMAKRQWIHVYDNCDAIYKIINHWKRGSVYNISSDFEITNLQLVKKILSLMGKSINLLEFVPDRLGQDMRYAIDAKLIKKDLAWKPGIKFLDGLEDTIKWYSSNKKWWKQLTDNKIKNPTPWL